MPIFNAILAVVLVVACHFSDLGIDPIQVLEVAKQVEAVYQHIKKRRQK